MVRVVVVDDEELVRSGFRLILQAAGDIEVVATVTGAQAVKEVGLQRSDVVLLDIRMPDVDGLTVLRQLRGPASPPVVAMLTTFDSDEYIATALRSGAAGFILKDTAPEQLAQLVRTLAAGGSSFRRRSVRHGHRAPDPRQRRHREGRRLGHPDQAPRRQPRAGGPRGPERRAALRRRSPVVNRTQTRRRGDTVLFKTAAKQFAELGAAFEGEAT